MNISLYTVIIHDGIDILATLRFIIHVHEITLAHRFIAHTNIRMPLDFLLSCYLCRVFYTSCNFCLSSLANIFYNNRSWFRLDTVVIKRLQIIGEIGIHPVLNVSNENENKSGENKNGFQNGYFPVYSTFFKHIKPEVVWWKPFLKI